MNVKLNKINKFQDVKLIKYLVNLISQSIRLTSNAEFKLLKQSNS